MSPLTRPIGAGTCNTALNMSTEERTLWGRFACENDASMNQTIQEAAMRGLAQINPALAAEIAKIRKQRGMVVKLAKASVGVSLALLMLVAASDRRTVRRVGLRRNEIEFAGVCA
jgi:hypothetical protein